MKMNNYKFLLAIAMMSVCFMASGVVNAYAAEEPNNLRFSNDGKFKVMVMSDIQDYVRMGQRATLDQRTTKLMNAALDTENPDLVVINGDHLGGDMNAKELQEYLTQMAVPIEKHEIPWLVTFGNHDEDAETAIKEEGWSKIRILEFFQTFKHNINRSSMSGAEKYKPNGINTIAVGDMYQLVYDHTGTTPLYNIWAMDTNSYNVYTEIGGYDWLLPEQVQWYYNTALNLNKQYGKLNALMFLHIPTPEFETMYKEKEKYGVIGSRYGTEFSSFVNSGIYPTLQLAGDVRGVFVAHAHENDYIGNYNGIYLAFDGSVGYHQYGPDMFPGSRQYLDLRDILRGVRIIELDSQNLDTFVTRMVYATDLSVNYTTKELGNILRQYGRYVVELQDKAGVDLCGWSTNATGETIYITPAGNVQTGWLTIADNFTYYFGENGVMRTGWQEIGDDIFYFYPDGKMAANTTVDGHEIGIDGVRK